MYFVESTNDLAKRSPIKGIETMASLSAGPRINARTTRRIHGGIKKLSLIATAEGLRFQGRDVSSEAIVSAVLFEFLDLTEKEQMTFLTATFPRLEAELNRI